MPTARPPLASLLADGDSVGEDVLGQPGRPAVHGSLCAENHSFPLEDGSRHTNADPTGISNFTFSTRMRTREALLYIPLLMTKLCV